MSSGYLAMDEQAVGERLHPCFEDLWDRWPMAGVVFTFLLSLLS